MNPDERFTRAVAALPGPVRERLDSDAPLDWTALEDARTGAELGEAARAHQRLSEAVEALAQRLVREVGIVPDDVVAGAARQGAAGAWSHRIAIEPEGESYRLRSTRTGDIHAGVRPEAIAGYAILALELAAAVHAARERWIEAGGRLHSAADGESDHLRRCAIAMRAALRSETESWSATTSGPATTTRIADALERVWNAQGFAARAALSDMRLGPVRGARAPEENHYAPLTGHRLHACSLAEMRWLAALAAHAAADAPPLEREDERAVARAVAETEDADATVTVEDATLADLRALEVRIRAAMEETDVLELGSDHRELSLERELDELGRVAGDLPGAVRRRLGNAYGIGFSQALSRLQDPAEAAVVRAEIDASEAGRTAPRWLEELAATLLMDTGARTRGGSRTSGLRLEPDEDAEKGYAATEVETGARGRLTLAGLVEQVRLSLAFAHEVWTSLSMLRSAGKEGDWTLNEGESEGREFAPDERETLEAARRIEQALERVQRAHARLHGNRAPSTLEQAAMAADTLARVGPEIRTAVEWTDTAEAPHARNPRDIARIAAVAEALRAQIRAIANHVIVGGIANAQAYGEAYEDNRRPPAAAATEPRSPSRREGGRPADANDSATPDPAAGRAPAPR